MAFGFQQIVLSDDGFYDLIAPLTISQALLIPTFPQGYVRLRFLLNRVGPGFRVLGCG
jgi:hypothetical protein